MYREQRIVLLIILSFFIYGLSSLVSLGDFVTPFFFSKLIFVVVSLAFLIMNLSLKKRGYLIFAFLAMTSLAFVDGFTVHILTKGGQHEALTVFFDSEILLYVSLLIFIGFYSSSIFLLHESIKKWWLTSLLSTFLAAGFICAYLGDMLFFEIAFGLYLIFYYVMLMVSNQPEKSVLSIMSALFLLQFCLELFKYLF
ncbi:MAG: hypothetical protein P8I55_12020 [Crocinitomix sp.]|nr:hypothetical protein [Crocinitomix sp.]